MNKNFETPDCFIDKNEVMAFESRKRSRRIVAGVIAVAGFIGIGNAMHEYNNVKAAPKCIISEENIVANADNSIVPGSALLLKINGIDDRDLSGTGRESNCIDEAITKIVDLNPELAGVITKSDLDHIAITGEDYVVPEKITAQL